MLSYIQSSQLFLDVMTTYTLLLRFTLYTTHFPKHLLSKFQFFSETSIVIMTYSISLF